MQTVFTFLQYSWLPAALAIAVFIAAYIVRFFVYHLARHISRTHAAYVASALQFGIVVGGLYGIAVYLKINPTTVLAVVAIATAGVALAMEQTIAGMIAGAVILANGKFSVGEQITIADVAGVVESIGFNNVTIGVNTRGLVTIPNTAIVGTTLVNHSRAAFVEMALTLPMFDSHDRRRADALIRQVLFAHKLDNWCKVLHDWSPGGEAWAVVVKVADYNKRRETVSKLSVALTEELRRENFPLGVVTFYKET